MSDKQFFEAANKILPAKEEGDPFSAITKYYETSGGYLYIKGRVEEGPLQACAVDAIRDGWGYNSVEELVQYLEHNQ